MQYEISTIQIYLPFGKSICIALCAHKQKCYIIWPMVKDPGAMVYSIIMNMKIQL